MTEIFSDGEAFAAGQAEPGALGGDDAAWCAMPYFEFCAGEARRARSAIACAGEPDYLVFDEPTEGLDGVAARRLADLVRSQAASGRGLLLVSHDEVFLARTADHLVVMYDGEVQGEGAPRDLIPAAFEESGRDG